MKTRIISLLSLLIIFFGHSQSNSVWKKVIVSNVSNPVLKERNLPKESLYQLNFSLLQNILENTTVRSSSFKKSDVIVQFPNIKGELKSFLIKETPFLQGDLARKYSNIRSYAGQGIDDPTSIIRFSISHKGLESTTFSGKDEVLFITPYSGNSIHKVYKRKHLSSGIREFECKTRDVISKVHSNKKGRTNADDGILRTYRLAVSVNGEYTQLVGGTVADALAAINTTMTRVNGIFEIDFGVTLQLISNNDQIIYTNPATDPFGGNYGVELQNLLTNVIGEANYDIGHAFIGGILFGSAGCIGCVCVDEIKGSAFSGGDPPTGDFHDVNIVAHEMGHQFGANHTYTIDGDEGIDPIFVKENVQMEPGSGSTIMGIAGFTGNGDVQSANDPYFHAISINQITNYIKDNNCQTNTNINNAIPTADAGQDYIIPKGTPFVLEGQGTDADNEDNLTYCWEQIDDNNAITIFPDVSAVSGVAFRSYGPTSSPQRYFPRLETIKTGATSWRWEAVPNAARNLNFRFTVRDNKVDGGSNNSDDMLVTVDANSGPFLVTSQNTVVTWQEGAVENITWNVANTDQVPINCSQVDILLSLDGGETYPVVLKESTPNDGDEDIVVPGVGVSDQVRIIVKGTDQIFFNINTVDFMIDSTLSIADIELEDFEIWPVPNSGVFNISFTPITTNIEINLYDLKGKLIDQKKFSNATHEIFLESFDYSLVEDGVYFVHIKTGNKTITRSIIKK